MIRYRLEIIASLFVAVAFGAGFLHALAFSGASMYLPAATCAVATTAALVWLLRLVRPSVRRKLLDTDGGGAPEDGTMTRLPGRTRLLRTVMILAMAAVFAGLIKTVGLVTMAFVFVLVGSRGLGASWRAALTAAACFAVTIYMIFGLLLQVALPPELLTTWFAGR